MVHEENRVSHGAMVRNVFRVSHGDHPMTDPKYIMNHRSHAHADPKTNAGTHALLQSRVSPGF
jgi:hypothetical protein